jgi:hypothetical protein
MAKKKVSRKRTTKKKGMSTLTKVLIGGAVIGGGWLIYDQFFAKKEDPEKAAADAAAAAQAGVEGQAAAAALNAVDPGTGTTKPPITSLLPDWMDPARPNDKRTLTPKGTPKEKQNFGIALYPKDKGGEIETLQRFFNRISKAYGKPGITVDGNYGNNTEQKRIAIFGTPPGVTLTQVSKMVKAVEEGTSDTIMTPLGITNTSSWLSPQNIPSWMQIKP